MSPWSILVSGSLQSSPISCKELGDIACRSNVSPFGQRLKFTCVLVFFCCHMDDWCHGFATTERRLNSGMDAEAHTWSLRFLGFQLEFSSVDLNLPNDLLYPPKKRRKQIFAKSKSSIELRPDLYLVHRKGFAVTVKSSRAVALRCFLVTLPSHRFSAKFQKKLPTRNP